MYDIGIIGGMGSEATAEMFKRFITYVDAGYDQEHMKICILNNSKIPDRTKAIQNCNNIPAEHINESISDLINLKCNSFVIACNTAHYFKNQFKDLDKIRFIDMIECTLQFIHERYFDYSVCILGTNGTVNAKVYSRTEFELNIIYPKTNEQEIIMKSILNTKKGLARENIVDDILNVMHKINDENNKTVFILGCTELSLYYDQIAQLHKVIDAMDMAVINGIIMNGYKLKENINNKIFKFTF